MLVVGGYFSQYDHEANWRYPGFLDAMVAGARTLHDDGVRSIVIAGEVPTWAPVLPILVGRDLLKRGAARGVLRVGVRPDSLATDRTLAAKDWGQGVVYVSQAEKLCGARDAAGSSARTCPTTCWRSTTATTASRARCSRSDHPCAGDRRGARTGAAGAIDELKDAQSTGADWAARRDPRTVWRGAAAPRRARPN